MRAIFAVMMLVGCGDDDKSPPPPPIGRDSGAASDARLEPDDPRSVLEPDEPALPAFSSGSGCGASEEEVGDGPQAYCAPSVSTFDECPPDPDDEPIYYYCGVPPVVGVTHVSGDADPATADGSSEHPYPDLASAGLQEDATVVLGSGRYVLPSTFPTGLRIVAGCRPSPMICDLCATLDIGEGIDVGARTLALEALTVEGEGGLRVAAGGSLTLSCDALRELRGVALTAESGSTVLAVNTTIVDTQPLADGTGGGSVLARADADVELDQVVLRGGHDFGVFADGAVVRMNDVTIRDSRIQRLYIDGVLPERDGAYGHGVAIDEATTLLSGLVVRNVHERGIGFTGGTHTVRFAHIDAVEGEALHASGAAHLDATNVYIGDAIAIGAYVTGEASLTARDWVVEDVAPGPSFNAGIAVVGAQATFARVQIERTPGGFLAHHGAQVDLTDATIRAIVPTGNADFEARAINVWDGAALDGERVAIEGYVQAGVAVTDAELRLVSTTIEDTFSDVAPIEGWALVVQRSPSYVRRIRIDNPRTTAIAIAGAASIGYLRDVEIRSPRMTSGGGARGIDVGDHAQLELENALVHGARELGLLVSGGARVAGGDVVIEDMLATDTSAARCVLAQDDAAIDLRRMLVRDCPGYGVTALGGDLLLTDLQVLDTMRSCETCERSDGIGVVVAQDSDVVLEDVSIERSASCGMFMEDSSTVSIRRARVIDNAVGLCVDRERLDTGSLPDSHLDNPVQVETRSVPIPGNASTAALTLAGGIDRPD